jgi:predicted acetyltransferase
MLGTVPPEARTPTEPVTHRRRASVRRTRTVPGMPNLVPATLAVMPSFVSALADYHAEGRYIGLDAAELTTLEGTERYLRRLADAATRSRIGSDRVPETTLWWVQGTTFLGAVRIRHDLTDELSCNGGHIDLDVTFGQRGRRHGTAMLRAALPVAAAFGLDEVLLTCSIMNVAAVKVINGVRAVPAGSFKRSIVRFWAATGSATVRTWHRLADAATAWRACGRPPTERAPSPPRWPRVLC